MEEHVDLGRLGVVGGDPPRLLPARELLDRSEEVGRLPLLLDLPCATLLLNVEIALCHPMSMSGAFADAADLK